jgi:hypothetical protein
MTKRLPDATIEDITDVYLTLESIGRLAVLFDDHQNTVLTDILFDTQKHILVGAAILCSQAAITPEAVGKHILEKEWLGPDDVEFLTQELSATIEAVRNHICPDCRARQEKLASLFGANLASPCTH